MATYTLANAIAAGMAAPSTNSADIGGNMVIEFKYDANKLALTTADNLQFFTTGTYDGIIVDAASVEVVTAEGTASTIKVMLNTTDITGLTTFDVNATAGTRSVLLASGANTAAATKSLAIIPVTATLDDCIVNIRVFCRLFVAVRSGA